MYELLVIGGSAGSLSVVLKILPHINRSLGLAIIIVFHRKNSEDTSLIEVLSRRTDCYVKEAEDKDELQPGTIYLAPADYHVLIEKDRSITLDDSEKINHSRPSIDVTFESAAEVYNSSLACMLLSGANADGVEGLISARKRGALILVQDPATAEVPFMPKQALERVGVDFLVKECNLRECPIFKSDS
ncbi:chemotaxis protein CheB [Chryseosolibacter indicus]|uniref:protein-glutamate methylesterase n=1 Tax=Chryseosolibacter indicus TaxID=2782351 RepID=A0ABS5VV76_9BACT|nr:chemotaxis protein CheB [Chryseosolibacter indicus]MBT1704774.1 chemotaxis protein CheB [Chryseosolibacter indicus]